MKLGIISDIHADIKALKLALDILQGQKADQVICAGDLIDKGYEGDNVIQLIRNRQIPSVRGNHDYASDKYYGDSKKSEQPDYLTSMSTESVKYLETLPALLRYEFEGKSVLVAHGTPWSNAEYVYHYSPREIFKQMANLYPADATILGHTHEPMVVTFSDKWFFNPGAVCDIHTYGSGTCATLTLPDCTFRVFDVRTGRRVQPEYVEFF